MRAVAAHIYTALSQSARAGLIEEGTTGLLADLTIASLALLRQAPTRDLISLVPGKAYFGFLREAHMSRPVRRDLFDFDLVEQNIGRFRDRTYTALPENELQRFLYTMAISYCCATDLAGRDDRKTPATFFEYLIGNIFGREFGVNPRTQVEVLNLDMRATLPTDFVFDLGQEHRRVHLPVKLSTRERVVQVWAHQKVLDGVYGVGRFRGVLVVLTETKVDKRSLEVIEICLPEQWRVYQLFIAQLFRVYYLDVPNRYAALRDVPPHIQVKYLSQFFGEKDALIGQ